MSGTSTAWLALQTQRVRATIIAFAAAAFVVILGGIAYACLPYHGEVSVYPVNPGGQAMDQFAHGDRAVTVHGGVGQTDDDGDPRGGMIWCDDSGGFEDGEPYQAGAIRPSANSPDLKLVVEDRRSGCVDDSGQWDLNQGEYHVAINHGVYSEEGNPDFDKNNIAEGQGDRAGMCYFQSGDDPDNFDYVHPEPLVVADGDDNDGELMIDNINMGPSSELGIDNVAGLCLRSDHHARTMIVPIEILGADTHPRNNGAANGRGNGPR